MAGDIPKNRPVQADAGAAAQGVSINWPKRTATADTPAVPETRGDDTTGIKFDQGATGQTSGTRRKTATTAPEPQSTISGAASSTQTRQPAPKVETGPITVLDEGQPLRAEDVPTTGSAPPALDLEQELETKRIVFDSAMRTSPPGIQGFFHLINDVVEKQASQLTAQSDRDADRPTMFVNTVMQHLPGMIEMAKSSVQPGPDWSAEDVAFLQAARTPQGEKALQRVLDAGKSYQAQQQVIAAKDEAAVQLNPMFGRANKREALKIQVDYTDVNDALISQRMSPMSLPTTDKATAQARLDHVMRYFAADHKGDYALSDPDEAATAAQLGADMRRYQRVAAERAQNDGLTPGEAMRQAINSDEQYCLLAQGSDGKFIAEPLQMQNPPPYMLLRASGDGTFQTVTNPDAQTIDQAIKDSKNSYPERRSVVVLQQYGEGGYAVMHDLDAKSLQPAVDAAKQQQPHQVALGSLGAKHPWLALVAYDAAPDEKNPPAAAGADQRAPIADGKAAQQWPAFAPIRQFADAYTGGRSTITPDSPMTHDGESVRRLIELGDQGNNEMLATVRANEGPDVPKLIGAAMKERKAAYEQSGQRITNGLMIRITAESLGQLADRGQLSQPTAAKAKAWLEVVQLRDRSAADFYKKWGGDRFDFYPQSEEASSPFQRQG
jgi:hypothetical protein